MAEQFQFDTSGEVRGVYGMPYAGCKAADVMWPDLSPGVQGCIAGMLEGINTKRCGWCGVKVVVAARKTGFGCGKHSQCTELVRDERLRLYIKGFSDLHPDTPTRIIADWEKAQRGPQARFNNTVEHGRRFWAERQAGIWLSDGEYYTFPPVTPYLNDEDKVCLKEQS